MRNTDKRPVLNAGIIRVVLEEADGTFTEGDVEIDGRDMRRYELVRARHNWPSYQGGGEFYWMAFCAWSALERSGEISEKFEAFEARCLEASTRDQDGAESNDGLRPGIFEVDPTSQASDITS
jgi:hypothetical protein